MEITVFGPGCARCEEAEKLAKDLAAQLGQEWCATIQVTKISDLREMMRHGVLATPAVAVNGVLKCTGRVPARDELAGWLEEARY